MWETFFGLGILVLFVAIAYGVRMSRSRNRSNDKVTEAAVREQYKDPEHYDPAKFERELKG